MFKLNPGSHIDDIVDRCDYLVGGAYLPGVRRLVSAAMGDIPKGRCAHTDRYAAPNPRAVVSLQQHCPKAT